MSFWDNNKDTFKAAGIASLKGAAIGGKKLAKVSYAAGKTAYNNRDKTRSAHGPRNSRNRRSNGKDDESDYEEEEYAPSRPVSSLPNPHSYGPPPSRSGVAVYAPQQAAQQPQTQYQQQPQYGQQPQYQQPPQQMQYQQQQPQYQQQAPQQQYQQPQNQYGQPQYAQPQDQYGQYNQQPQQYQQPPAPAYQQPPQQYQQPTQSYEQPAQYQQPQYQQPAQYSPVNEQPPAQQAPVQQPMPPAMQQTPLANQPPPQRQLPPIQPQAPMQPQAPPAQPQAPAQTMPMNQPAPPMRQLPPLQQTPSAQGIPLAQPAQLAPPVSYEHPYYPATETPPAPSAVLAAPEPLGYQRPPMMVQQSSSPASGNFGVPASSYEDEPPKPKTPLPDPKGFAPPPIHRARGTSESPDKTTPQPPKRSTTSESLGSNKPAPPSRASISAPAPTAGGDIDAEDEDEEPAAEEAPKKNWMDASLAGPPPPRPFKGPTSDVAPPPRRAVPSRPPGSGERPPPPPRTSTAGSSNVKEEEEEQEEEESAEAPKKNWMDVSSVGPPPPRPFKAPAADAAPPIRKSITPSIPSRGSVPPPPARNDSVAEEASLKPLPPRRASTNDSGQIEADSTETVKKDWMDVSKVGPPPPKIYRAPTENAKLNPGKGPSKIPLPPPRGTPLEPTKDDASVQKTNVKEIDITKLGPPPPKPFRKPEEIIRAPVKEAANTESHEAFAHIVKKEKPVEVSEVKPVINKQPPPKPVKNPAISEKKEAPPIAPKKPELKEKPKAPPPKPNALKKESTFAAPTVTEDSEFISSLRGQLRKTSSSAFIEKEQSVDDAPPKSELPIITPKPIVPRKSSVPIMEPKIERKQSSGTFGGVALPGLADIKLRQRVNSASEEETKGDTVTPAQVEEQVTVEKPPPLKPRPSTTSSVETVKKAAPRPPPKHRFSAETEVPPPQPPRPGSREVETPPPQPARPTSRSLNSPPPPPKSRESKLEVEHPPPQPPRPSSKPAESPTPPPARASSRSTVEEIASRPRHASPPVAPPSRNANKKQAPVLNLQIESGWWLEDQAIKLPNDLAGCNYALSFGYSSDESFKVFAFRLKDLSTLKLRFTWSRAASDPLKSYNLEQNFIPAPQPTTVKQIITSHEKYGEYVASWCENKQGQKVGSGECWDLAHDALQKGCGKHAFVSDGYNHGYMMIEIIGSSQGPQFTPAPISDEIRRGDILQFKSCVFKYPNSMVSYGAPDHTAVVLENRDGQVLEIIHQNVNGVKLVQKGEVDLSGFNDGEIKVFRPMDADWIGKLDASWP